MRGGASCEEFNMPECEMFQSHIGGGGGGGGGERSKKTFAITMDGASYAEQQTRAQRPMRMGRLALRLCLAGARLLVVLSFKHSKKAIHT